MKEKAPCSRESQQNEARANRNEESECYAARVARARQAHGSSRAHEKSAADPSRARMCTVHTDFPKLFEYFAWSLAARGGSWCATAEDAHTRAVQRPRRCVVASQRALYPLFVLGVRFLPARARFFVLAHLDARANGHAARRRHAVVAVSADCRRARTPEPVPQGGLCAVARRSRRGAALACVGCRRGVGRRRGRRFRWRQRPARTGVCWAQPRRAGQPRAKGRRFGASCRGAE